MTKRQKARYSRVRAVKTAQPGRVLTACSVYADVFVFYKKQ
jgi:hypothetical protein